MSTMSTMTERSRFTTEMARCRNDLEDTSDIKCHS